MKCRGIFCVKSQVIEKMEYVNGFESFVRSVIPPTWNTYINENLSQLHPYAKALPLMNPFHVVLITLAYLVVIFLGVQIMKHSAKFEIKMFTLVHNAFLILLSAYMWLETLRQAMNLGYGFYGNQLYDDERGKGVETIFFVTILTPS
jgi:hypothetical protein